jgi:uncharacterized circularly permuted ATP-grasp superfamily protein
VTGEVVLSDAVARYHDLLTPELAEESYAHLDHSLRRRGLVFGGRALCTVLRPRFLTLDGHRQLQRRIVPLMRAFRRAYELALVDSEFRAQFGLTDWEEVLLDADPRYRSPSPTSRLDFFYSPTSGALGLTEYNAETPAGAAYNDALAETFLDLPAMRAFNREYDVFVVAARQGVTGALLDAYHEYTGSRDRPRVAILDWRGVPTETEFELYQEHLVGMGIECIIDDPRHAEYRDRQLYVGGAPVDLIYKRVLINELVDRCGLESPVVRAVRDGTVCMVDGFRCKILHKKASLAVLSDEANVSLFAAAERRAIAECIPWTRVVRQRKTVYRDAPVDLVSFIVRERERFVLKPNDDYGGRGITLGWTVDGASWERAVSEALESPHIVQEQVAIPCEPYPSWVDGRLEIFERQYDTAPFVTNGEHMEGLLTRLSTDPLLNVTAGGGSTVPTFLVEKR